MATPRNGSWQDVRETLRADAPGTGKLEYSVPTRMEGKLKGELRATDLVVIGAQAVVHANVHVEKLVVLGEVRGHVTGVSRVEICSGGRVFGEIETRALVVREGARFEGRSRMGLSLVPQAREVG
jgi:cytoskeletal protein CcmA (bactofilin family)